MSSMNSHGASHMAQIMPNEMAQIGTSMHKSATKFALIAQEEELKPALKALSDITESCIACLIKVIELNRSNVCFLVG